MLYTKTYQKKALEEVEKLDDALGIVEGAVADLSRLTKDTVKSVKGDSDLEELLDKMMATVGDLYVYKNTLIEEITNEVEL